MTTTQPQQFEGHQLSPQQQAVCLREGAGSLAVRTVHASSEIDPRELATRMKALVATHEILRTRYVEVTGPRMPVQVVDPAGSLLVEKTPHGGTLLRAGQLTVEHDGTHLVLGLPRLSVDRTSWSLLTAALLEGPAADAQVLQYADVAAWLNEELARSGQKPEETDRASLPFLRPVALRDADAPPATVVMTVAGTDLDRLRTVARDLVVNESALLLTAWSSLLMRYTSDADDPLLMVTGGRSADGLSGMPGLLERPVAVRLPIDGTAPFAEAVEVAVDALGTAGVEEARCHPLAGGDAPSFRYQWDPWAAVTEPGLFESSEPLGVVHLDCVEGPDSLFLTFAGAEARFAKADLVSLAEAFRHLLADALADSGRAVRLLRLLAPTEEPCDSSSETGDRQVAVLNRFLEQVVRAPHRPAVRCGDEVLTYGELAHRAQAAGSLLRDHGVKAGDLVPVLATASADTLVAMLGTWLAEAAFVPLDPAWPRERMEAVLRQFDPPLVLVPPAAAGISFPVAAVPLPDRHDVPGGPAPTAVSTDGAAYLIFTSGTSGSPKGVVIGHDQLAHYAGAILDTLRLPQGAEFAAVSTLAADLSYTAIFPTLANGGCVQLVDADVATSPQALAERLREHPVSAMKVGPAHLSALLAEADDPMTLLPREVLVVGGETFPGSLYDRLRELAPRLRVYNHYGPTESTIGASCLPLGTAIDERCASVPVGAGLGANVLTVVDDEGNPLPPWCPGEVLISGPGVGLGYLAELREGRSGFGSRPSGPHYRSGDLGRLVPGHGVEIIDRLDDQVKLRGHRIQLSEIEGLLREQPGVAGAAVVARRNESGLVSHLDAYVVRSDNAPPIENLPEALCHRLPAALVPTGWQELDRLPVTRNGKLDRQALAPVEP